MASETLPIADSNVDPEELFEFLKCEHYLGPLNVYKAIDKRNSELVTIKIIPYNDDEYSNTVTREIKIQKRIHSSYIVNIKEVFIKHENIYIITSYCIGSVLDIINITQMNLKEKQIQIIMR
eukprot:942464_1